MPMAGFFLLPSRGWELAVGALLAIVLGGESNLKQARLTRESLSALGFSMILYAVFVFDKNVPFPGIHALIPVLGAAAIIAFASPDTIVGRLLSLKPVVATGLISYSAYLWHQPVFAFVRHRSFVEPEGVTYIYLIALVLALAYLSWRFVEKPFRDKSKVARKTVFLSAFVVSVIFVCLGTLGYFAKGWPGRLHRPMVMESTDTKCSSSSFDTKAICRSSEKKETGRVMLIGDSHAGALGYSLENVLSEKRVGLQRIYKGGCPPVKGLYRVEWVSGYGKKKPCFEYNEKQYEYIKGNSDIEFVVMLARWTLFLEGNRFDNGEGGLERDRRIAHFGFVENGQSIYKSDYSHRVGLAKKYIKSISELLESGKKVILVYPVPEVGWNVKDYMHKYFTFDDQKTASLLLGSTSYETFKNRNRMAYKVFDSLGDREGLYRVFPEKIFCGTFVKDRCAVHDGKSIFYRDDDHLSDAGATLVAEKVAQVIMEDK